MKKILLVLIAMGVIVGIFYFFNKEEAVAPVVISPFSTDKAELCFAKFGVPDKNGYYDKYTLRLILDGEKAKGELNFLPAEKDSKIGEFEGVISAVDEATMTRTANLWWFADAEGMVVKEELKIIFGEGTASIGFGEMIDRGDGVYVYKDSKNISFTLNLEDVACLDFTKRVNIENYLQDNISELSPVKAVLGGTWYVVSDTIDLLNDSGTVMYEDGHIQEKKNFTYTLNEKGEVVNLTIQ